MGVTRLAGTLARLSRLRLWVVWSCILGPLGVMRVTTINKEKLLEQELKAHYLYSPLNGRFVKVERVTALVLKAVRKFKSIILKILVQEGKY